jgi:hypothetical protein
LEAGRKVGFTEGFPDGRFSGLITDFSMAKELVASSAEVLVQRKEFELVDGIDDSILDGWIDGATGFPGGIGCEDS